jgi:hypothetical protein
MARKKSKKKKTPPHKPVGPSPPASSGPGLDLKRILPVVRSPWLWLGIMIMVGFGFRYSNAIFKPLIYPDSLQYMSLAEEIKTGEIFSRDYELDEGFLRSRRLPPFYSTLLALFSFLPVEMEVLGSYISIIMSLASFLPLFILGRKLVSDWAGVCAAAVFSFQWFVLRYASPLLTEATFTFTYILIAALGIYVFMKPRVWLLVLLGVLCSISYMTRDVGITSVFWIAIFGGIYWRWIEKTNTRNLAKRLGILFGVFLIASFPYLLHIRMHSDKWGLTPQMGGEQLSGQIIQFGGSRLDRDKPPGEGIKEESGQDYFEGGKSGLAVIPKKLVFLFKDYFYQFLIRMGWLLSACFFINYVFVIYLLAKSRDGEGIFREAYIFLWIIQLAGLYALVTPYMVDERYMYPIIPLGILAASAGMIRVTGGLAGFMRSRSDVWPKWAPGAVRLIPVLLVPVVFITLYPDYKILHMKLSKKGMYYKYAAGHKEVARDVMEKGLISPGKMILSRKPFMAYYLKGNFEFLPKTYPELLRYIEDKKGDYIVADSFVLKALRPLLTPIAFGFQPDPDPEITYITEKKFLIKSNRITFSPPPSTRIIYSRYLPEYRRVITIYEIQPEITAPETLTGTPEQHLTVARQYISNGYYYNGLKESEKALELDPNTEKAYLYITYIYRDYFKISLQPYFLQLLESTSYTWININPESKEARDMLAFVKRARNKLKQQ